MADKYVSDAGVRFRKGPSTKEPIITSFVKGEKVEVPGCDADVDGLNWSVVIRNGVRGWAATQYLQDTPPATQPSPVPVHDGTAIHGLHILPNCDTGAILNLLSDTAANRTPVPYITLCAVHGNPPISVAEIKRRSPQTVVIVRLLDGNDYRWNAKTLTRADGLKYYNDTKWRITADHRKADAIQLWNINEPAIDDGDGVANWWLGVLDGAEADGIKVAVLCWSVGYPPLPKERDTAGNLKPGQGFWASAKTHELLRRVKAKKHFFLLHQYLQQFDFDNTWDIRRNERIYANFPADLKDVPLWIGEFGWSWLYNQPAKSADALDRLLTTMQVHYGNVGYIKGTALWTLGDSGGWTRDMWDAYLYVYRSWLFATKKRSVVVTLVQSILARVA